MVTSSIVLNASSKIVAAFFLLLCGSGGTHEFAGPQGTVAVDWQTPDVSRILSSGYGDSFGIEAAVKMGFPQPETIDDKACINGSYFLFDVDDEFAFDIDETITLEILFDRTQSEGFWVSHDRNAMSEPLQEIRFLPEESRWYTQTVTLDRARFANRGQSGSDFAIAALSAMWPGIPGDEHRVVICELKIRRSNDTVVESDVGRLRLSVSGPDDQITPVRIGIYDESGRMPLPEGRALTIKNYDDLTRQLFLRSTHSAISPWPHSNRHFFYIDGEYEAPLPVGTYTVIFSKGPEYDVVSKSIEVRPGEIAEERVSLSRWADMPSLGWYSGDDHIHMTRDEEDNVSIGAIMQAEDVHVSNILQMGNPFDTHFLQYGFGRAGRYVIEQHALIPGVEDPRTALRGHTISLNIDELHRPNDKYLRYEEIFAEYRKQGGMSGYAHVAGELFNVGRGLAVDVPLGAVDFVEILQDGILATDLWYDFLNLGFVLTPTAGSDFPYLSAPGGERNYVYVGEEFDVDKWYERLRANRTFVTNGPMLTFTINGEPMGSHVRLSPGDEIRISASASMNPDIEQLDRLELIAHGEIIAVTDNVTSGNSISIEHVTHASDGIWFAVRAYGEDQAAAHTAPIFVSAGEGFEKKEAVESIANRMLGFLEEFQTLEADETVELEAWSVSEPLESMLDEQHAHILERAELARMVYARMIDQH